MSFADHVGAAADQAWPPFVLVAGLLLIGLVAARDGLFAAAGGRLAGLPGGETSLFGAALVLVVGVTAFLNLDTAVWFLTPVLVHAARWRRADERPLLYGSVMLANASSLILPGANLTNLIVLQHERVTGATFAARIWPVWVAAVLVTGLVVRLAFLRTVPVAAEVPDGTSLRLGLGLVGIVAAAVLVLVLSAPALPVFAVGLVLVMLARIAWRDVRTAASPHVLAALFTVAVVLGTVARTTTWPAHFLAHHSRWVVAALAAGVSVVCNNLPAAVLLSAHVPAHARSLLIGLNIGPNLFVTGSLSSYLWWRAARSAGARPSVGTYAKLGAVAAPLAGAAAVLALHALASA